MTSLPRGDLNGSVYIDDLADKLDVTCASLKELHVGWNDAEGCYTFPEFDGLSDRVMPSGRARAYKLHFDRGTIDAEITVNLEMEASDSSGSVLSIAWYVDDQKVASGSAVSLTFTAAGAFYPVAAVTDAGFDITPGEHPIVPIMLGDARLASGMAADMLEEGIYVIGFSFPVVPKGQARIRVQLSAGQTQEHLERCVEAFVRVGRRHGVIT